MFDNYPPSPAKSDIHTSHTSKSSECIYVNHDDSIINSVNIGDESKSAKRTYVNNFSNSYKHDTSNKEIQTKMSDMEDAIPPENELLSHSSSTSRVNSRENDSISTQSNTNFLGKFGLVKKGLRIGNLNVCHLLPKLDEVKLLLNDQCSVNILGLCETFLNDQVDDKELLIDGFNFERKDRDDGRSGGGVMLYITNEVSYKRRCDIEGDQIESIWIEVINEKQ